MDKTGQSDLVIIVAGAAGVTVATIVQTLRGREREAGEAAFNPLIFPSFLAATTMTRRGGKIVGLYPKRTLLLGAAAFGLGAGLVLASNVVGHLLPRSE
jgi:hypothetical protein